LADEELLAEIKDVSFLGKTYNKKKHKKDTSSPERTLNENTGTGVDGDRGRIFNLDKW